MMILWGFLSYDIVLLTELLVTGNNFKGLSWILCMKCIEMIHYLIFQKPEKLTLSDCA
jgi:hypothetical protein